MANERLQELTQAQRDRLAFIDLRLRYTGDVGRQDLAGRFGIQGAAASRDIAQYRALAPRNLVYDTTSKLYRPSEWFVPLFDFSPERVLTWLTQAYGDVEPARGKSALPFGDTALKSSVDLEVLSVLTRSIYSNSAVHVSYRSLSTGLTTMEILPFALADTGLSWHVRAFDRRHGDFSDFVIGRIEEARLIPGEAKDHERQDQDIQWNRITELELVPHPANVRHPDSVEADFGMQNGVLVVQARAAMAGYLLRRWNVDCTEDHSIKGGVFHLWLRNRQALYGVTNLGHAPGYHGDAIE